MTKVFSTWLQNMSTGWVTLLSLIIFMLFTAVVLPGQAKNAESISGDGGTPDLSLIYSKQDLYKWAETYGDMGRKEYIRVRFTFDLIWPLVYTLFLTTAISWLYASVFPEGNYIQQLNLVPILAMLFDFFENISTSLIMSRYPEQTTVIDSLAPVFTFIKWLFVALSFVILVIGVFAASGKWIKSKT